MLEELKRLAQLKIDEDRKVIATGNSVPNAIANHRRLWQVYLLKSKAHLAGSEPLAAKKSLYKANQIFLKYLNGKPGMNEA
jgi:hypothetical protein